MMFRKYRTGIVPLLFTLSILLSACSFTAPTTFGNSNGPIKIQLFFHSGQGPERDALNATLEAFSQSNPDITVETVQLPENRYTEQVNLAAMAHSLPCLLDFDGPTLYNYAWSGYLIPLDKYVSPAMKADFLPSIIKQGTYNHHLYSLGQFDSGLGIYANKRDLEEVGARIPTIEHPWTLTEFNSLLAKLKKVPGVQYPLDLKMDMSGEWFTYGFSPFVESFGGDLINRTTYQSADGVLNGPAAIAAMSWLQSLFKLHYSNPWPAGTTDFTSGRSALSWVGHWAYADYSSALGNNLLVLPAPNLGKGAKTGMGSWNWGITSSCKNPDAAWRVLHFILSPDEVLRMSNANGAVPARKSAIAQSKLYAPNGPLHVFVQQLQMGIAEPRPITPAYPTITSAFAQAVVDIAAGANVKKELNRAVQAIDQDIKDNDGYPIE